MNKISKVCRLVLLLLTIVFLASWSRQAKCQNKNGTKPQTNQNTEQISIGFPSTTPESQGLDPISLAKLAEVVQGYFDSEQIVGAELLVIKNRFTVLHEVFGWRDRENEMLMKKNTVFNIRSMTKPLTGAGIQILIDSGKMKLQDQAAEYLPGFKNEKSKSITIEQLLTHRSGLPLTSLSNLTEKVQGLSSLSDAILAEFPDLYAMTNKTGEHGPHFEPDSKFWYSDAGSDVLGAIIEVASGIPLHEFFKRHFFIPLGMKDSFVITRWDSTGLNRVAALYTGAAGSWSKVWNPKDGPLYPFAWGSQTIYCTLQDYARFLAMWMDVGMIHGKQLLSEQSVERTLKPVSRMTSLGSDTVVPTGFPGLETMYGQMSVLYIDPKAKDPNKPVVIGHSGSDGTFAWAWPELDLMILYFTQSRGQATGLKLETEIDKLLIHPSASEEIAVIPDRFKPYIGKYTANFGPYRNVIFEVLEQNKNLAVDVPGQMVFELNEPDEEGWRTFKFTNLVSIYFQEADSGKVAELHMHQVTKIPRKVEQDSTIVAVPDKYLPYPGKYAIPMTNQEMVILVQNGRLALDPPNDQIILLKEPDKKGRWFFEIDDRTAVSFDRDETDKVTGMNLHQIFVIRKGEAAAKIVEKMIESDGILAAISKYHELKSSSSEEHFFDERSFNSLGYKLIGRKKFPEAVEILKLNAEEYPNSFNVYDSLGEAYMKNGEKELAIRNYKKSLELNAQNENGKNMLKKLEEM